MWQVNKQASRGRRVCNGATVVARRFRRLISWLLILVMSIGPYQASMAMHIDLNDPGQNYQILIEQSRETAIVNDIHNCIASNCQVINVCAAHLNCNPLNPSSPPGLGAQAQLYYHLLIGDESVSTRFPDPLKRPPRS